MTSLQPTTSPDPMAGHDSMHAEHWHILQDARQFRTQQLAALEAETSPHHGSLNEVLRYSATAALEEIDAALERMKEGRYGLCVSCERQIDAERLSVLPMTPCCMSCHYNEQNCHVAMTSSHRG